MGVGGWLGWGLVEVVEVVKMAYSEKLLKQLNYDPQITQGALKNRLISASRSTLFEFELLISSWLKYVISTAPSSHVLTDTISRYKSHFHKGD